MQDDPESIKARKVHAEWMETTALGEETAEMAETLAALHPKFGWLAKFLGWLVRISRREEEKARLTARDTYR